MNRKRFLKIAAGTSGLVLTGGCVMADPEYVPSPEDVELFLQHINTDGVFTTAYKGHAGTYVITSAVMNALVFHTKLTYDQKVKVWHFSSNKHRNDFLLAVLEKANPDNTIQSTAIAKALLHYTEAFPDKHSTIYREYPKEGSSSVFGYLRVNVEGEKLPMSDYSFRLDDFSKVKWARKDNPPII